VPLEDPQAEIRLLTILPGDSSSKLIKCRLHKVNLSNPGEYEGLSYHWFGPVNNLIGVNGIEIAVGLNLFIALRTLRYPDKPRVLCVDALCIDQDDDDENGEKNNQVRIMRQIYQQSQRTVAWFGAEERGYILTGAFVEKLLPSKG
jgi:hypothetical protein